MIFGRKIILSLWFAEIVSCAAGISNYWQRDEILFGTVSTFLLSVMSIRLFISLSRGIKLDGEDDPGITLKGISTVFHSIPQLGMASYALMFSCFQAYMVGLCITIVFTFISCWCGVFFLQHCFEKNEYTRIGKIVLPVIKIICLSVRVHTLVYAVFQSWFWIFLVAVHWYMAVVFHRKDDHGKQSTEFYPVSLFLIFTWYSGEDFVKNFCFLISFTIENILIFAPFLYSESGSPCPIFIHDLWPNIVINIYILLVFGLYWIFARCCDERVVMPKPFPYSPLQSVPLTPSASKDLIN